MSISTFETLLQISLFVLIATPIVSLLIVVLRRAAHLSPAPFGFGDDEPAESATALCAAPCGT